jgi:phosphoribosylaminoimidazolecarboxamide formyltransferase/IMP cyclohydrolase
MDRIPIRRAIISVSEKEGLAELARALAAADAQIYSTGGTRQFLLDQGIKVVDVAVYTAFPEMMHGRVKTLHPKVFGGAITPRTWRRPASTGWSSSTWSSSTSTRSGRRSPRRT